MRLTARQLAHWTLLALLALTITALAIPTIARAEEPDMATGAASASTTGFAKVYTGGYHSMGIKADGTVWAWGQNNLGQLGDGTTIERNSPVQITSLTGARQIILGDYHSMAIKADGTVWAWGDNAFGELGDSTTTQHNSPEEITTLTGARQISLGDNYSMAIKADGTVWAWGYNGFGQLGDGTITNESSPEQITSLIGARQLSLSGNHSMAIKADGTVWTWGQNTYGQLGDGTTTQRDSPVQIISLIGARQLSLGYYDGMAIMADGTVRAWGYNANAQLGDGTNTNESSPEQITALTGARQLSLGDNYSMAIKADGTVWAWGNNAYGQLGDGTNVNESSPEQITTLTGARQISLGFYHSMATKSDGTVLGWGDNNYGQLGDGTTTNRTSPVVSLFTLGCGFVQVITGPDASSTFGIKADGTVWAWGYNYYGELGDGTTTNESSPEQITTLTGARQISVGGDHSMAIKADGTVWAWGYNAVGELGDGTTTQRTSPVQITTLTGARQISVGGDHSMAIMDDGTVWAWGYNYDGDLGDGTTTNESSPEQITTLTGTRQISLGGNHSMAIKADGSVWAWGWNGNGALGDGTTTERTRPVTVSSGCNAPPNASGALAQYRSDGVTVIASAAWTPDGNSTNIVLKFNVSDPDTAQALTPWIEVEPSATPFSAMCGASVAGVTFSGSSVSAPTPNTAVGAAVSITGLAANTTYHWRACAVDQGPLPGPWLALGGSPDFGIDFVAPTGQYVSDTNAQAGATEPSAIQNPFTQLSWINNTGAVVDRQRVQVQTDPLDNVVALYHLDDPGGADASGNGHTLTFENAGWSPSMTGFGSALSLDGTSSSAITNASSAFDLTQFTAEAWFSMPDAGTSGYANILERSQSPTGCSGGSTCNYEIDWRPGSHQVCGELTVSGSDHALCGGSSALIGSGYHYVALTVDASHSMSLYIDGSLAAGPTTLPAAPDDPTGALAIGRSAGGERSFFHGTVDDVRISSVARTADQIAGYYHTFLPHDTTLWDSDTTDAGVSLSSACATGTRCPDIAYGSSGSALGLIRDQARYYARAKLRAQVSGGWSDWSSWDYFNTVTSTTISIPSGGSVSLGTGLPNTDDTGSSTLQTSSNNASGYTVTATSTSDTIGMSSGANSIARWTGAPAAPTTWSAGVAGGFGLTLLSAPGGKNTTTWGTGTTPADVANLRYVGLKLTAPTQLYTTPTGAWSTDTTSVGYRADIGSAQAPGTYATMITYTSLANS